MLNQASTVNVIAQKLQGWMTTMIIWLLCREKSGRGPTDKNRLNRCHLHEQMMAWKNDEEKWKTNVGFTYKTFKEIKEMLEKLAPHLVQRNGRGPRKQSLELRLLICLILLRNGSAQYNLERETGFGRQTISNWFDEIVEAFNSKNVINTHIELPLDKDELETISRGFECFEPKMPNIVGAIDGTHVAVRMKALDYGNVKGYQSINIQVLCDHQYLIRDVSGGLPGSCSDHQVFKESHMPEYINFLSQRGHKTIHDVPVSYYIVGDAGFPHRPGLQIPFIKPKGRRFATEESDWNYWLSSSRMVIEQCFGMLKGRFKILVSTGHLNYKPKKVAKIFMACCVLHNICMLRNDKLAREEWDEDLPSRDWDASRKNDIRHHQNATDGKLKLAQMQRMAILHHLEQIHSSTRKTKQSKRRRKHL